jgi:hypothetical protein
MLENMTNKQKTCMHHQTTQCMWLYLRKKTRKSRRIEFFRQQSILKQLASRGS